jgi:hypothetical protein
MDQTNQTQSSAVPHSAALLAYTGSLPLLVGSILTWFVSEELATNIVQAVTIYAITLLVFFGGVRWGIAVMRPEGPTFLQLLASLAPAVVGFTIIFLPSTLWQLLALTLVMPILLWDDLRATRKGSGAPEWYLGVRAPLTAFVVISLLIAIAQLILG